MLKLTTFGNSKVDLVLAEHLNKYPEMAKWSCRTISKTVDLLHDLKMANIQNKKFQRTVFSYIKCAMTNRVNNPPAHIDEKTKTFTANIVNRHLATFLKNMKTKK